MSGAQIVKISLPSGMENAEIRQNGGQREIKHGGYFPGSQSEISMTNEVVNGLENNLELESEPSITLQGK